MGYYKAGVSDAEFQQDRYTCQQQAVGMYPVLMQTTVVSQGYQLPITTNCQRYGNQTSCQTNGGQTVQPTTTTDDANKWNRLNAASSCMSAKGYQFKFN
jgi:hypothetical protein